MSNTELFKDISIALYGPRWQSELARKTSKDGRTIRRYAAGQSTIPDEVWDKLSELLDKRGEEVAELKERIQRQKQ